MTKNKSIILSDNTTVKVGEPIFYRPLGKVMYLEECNREKSLVKVSDFSFTQQAAFFRGATDEEILKQ
jgi:hypothetical protein